MAQEINVKTTKEIKEKLTEMKTRRETFCEEHANNAAFDIDVMIGVFDGNIEALEWVIGKRNNF